LRTLSLDLPGLDVAVFKRFFTHSNTTGSEVPLLWYSALRRLIPLTMRLRQGAKCRNINSRISTPSSRSLDQTVGLTCRHRYLDWYSCADKTGVSGHNSPSLRPSTIAPSPLQRRSKNSPYTNPDHLSSSANSNRVRLHNISYSTIEQAYKNQRNTEPLAKMVRCEFFSI
jgi:hypothetical protein